MAISTRILLYGSGIYLLLLGGTLLLAGLSSNGSRVMSSGGVLVSLGIIIITIQPVKRLVTSINKIAASTIRRFESKYGINLRAWFGVFLVSLLISGLMVFEVKYETKQSLVGNIFPGLLTLFALTLTVMTLGIQLASTRYSFRVDKITARPDILLAYFWPFLVSLIFGVLIQSRQIEQLIPYATILFLSVSVLAAYSIFDYVRWTLDVLRPTNLVQRFIDDIDQNYILKVVEELESEYEPSKGADFLRQIVFLEPVTPDPLDVVTDVTLSRIRNGDTIAARSAFEELNKVSNTYLIKPQLDFSLHQEKLLTWHFLGHYNRIFEQSKNADNEDMMLIVIKTISNLIQESIGSDKVGTEFESIRLLRDLTTKEYTDWTKSAVQSISDEINGIGKRYSSQIDEGGSIDGITIYLQVMRQFTFLSIEHGVHGRNLMSSISTLQTISRKLLQKGAFPKEILLTISLVGEEAARHNAISRQMVMGADVDTSMTDIAERSIVSLLTIRDTVVESDLSEDSKNEIADYIDERIASVQDELEEKDQYIINSVCDSSDVSESTVRRVLQELRRHRRPIPKENIMEVVQEGEEQSSRTVKKTEIILTDLDELGVVYLNNGRVSSSLSRWRPQEQLREIESTIQEGEVMIAKVADSQRS